MLRTNSYRWGWCLSGGKTLALCAALVCFSQGSAARAQCEGGGSAAMTGGGATAFGGGAAVPLGGQFQAMQAQMARMQALQAMQAQQQAAARQRELAARQRAEAAEGRRMGLASLSGDRAACSDSARQSNVRATFAEQADRTTARERQVQRMRERDRKRQAALQARIAERDAAMNLRRQRALAQR